MIPTNSTTDRNQSFSRTNAVVVSILVITAAIAWASEYYLMLMGGMTASGGMVAMLVSPHVGSLIFFLLVWVVGMVAMMFPTMVPVISIYNMAIAKSKSQRMVGSGLFLAGYLTMYLGLGLVAYLTVLLLSGMISALPFLWNYGAIGLGIVLITTGLWQLTPLKNTCLRHCVSPLGFFMTHTKQGLRGALRMGAEHGYFCVGCCYMYMLVMFVVTGMSLPAMALLAIMITLEKAVLKGARWFNWFTSAIFIGLGLIAWVLPSSLGMI